jgi:hypothetical protein
MAAAGDLRPQAAAVEHLQERLLGLRGGDHVLVEAQLAVRLEHTPDLPQGARLIRHAAQHQAHHHGIEAGVREGQVVDVGVEHGPAGGLGPRAQRRLRLDRGQLDRGGIAGKVAPVARADLQDPAVQAAHERVAVPRRPAGVGTVGCLRVEASEPRMLHVN